MQENFICEPLVRTLQLMEILRSKKMGKSVEQSMNVSLVTVEKVSLITIAQKRKLIVAGKIKVE